MPKTITGVNGGTFPNQCTVPVAGDFITGNSVETPCQALLNECKYLKDTKADLTGADFTGSCTIVGDLGVDGNVIVTGDLDVGDDLAVTGLITVDGDLTPTQNPGADNVIAAPTIAKAGGYITVDSSGNVTLEDGFNIASAVVDASKMLITFARPFANNTYWPVVSPAMYPCGFQVIPDMADPGTTASALVIYFQELDGTSIVPTTTELAFSILVGGRQ